MSNQVEAYLCLCEDGTYIAHEGPRYDLPNEVIEIWDKNGRHFTREVQWTEELFREHTEYISTGGKKKDWEVIPRTSRYGGGLV